MKILYTIGLSFLLFSCTKLNDPPAHPSRWADPNFENSHLAKIAITGIKPCQVCHGGDYYGGNAGVACKDCHDGGQSGHEAFSVWVGSPVDTTATLDDQKKFHGTTFLLDQRCVQCHDYFHATRTQNRGDNSVNVYCTDCHTRNEADPGSKILLDRKLCHNGRIAFQF